MKSFLKNLIIYLPLILSFSCVNKETTLKSVSPNKITEIEINAKKSSIASPWVLSIGIKKDGKLNTFQTEMYAEEPNVENVLFDWSSDSRCSLTLIEQDGAKRSIPIILE